MIRASLLLLLLVGIAAPGAAQGTDSTVAVAEIRARRESSNLAIARHDTAGHGAILAPHAILVSSASVQQVGRALQLQSFAELFAASPDVVYRRTPGAVRVYAPWAMASEEGMWAGSWTEPDGKVSIGGRYFAKWRRIAGVWLVESETYVPERCSGSAFCQRVP